MKTGIVIGLVITLFSGLMTGCSGRPRAPAADENAAGEAVSAKGQVWTCSMHPQIRQNDPGQCPICGMNLIPADQDDGADQ